MLLPMPVAAPPHRSFTQRVRSLRWLGYLAPPALAALVLCVPEGPRADPTPDDALAAAPTASSSGLKSYTIPADFQADRMRVFAAPGDLALTNGQVTLVVRKRDGWLVDFWHNQPTRATGGQLGGHTHIDGLWQLHPVLHDGKNQVDVVATKVRILGDSIETSAALSLGAGRMSVTTSYRLEPDEPRIIITTKFNHLSGGRLTHLNLGDAVKWGNTDYFVDGKRQKATFNGKGKWVGRQGASGDLKLSTLEGKPMLVGFRSYHNGLSGEIRTAYRNVALNPGESVVVQRALEYDPISIDEKPPKTKPGTLKVSVRDGSGKRLAAKLSIRGLGLTRSPDFGNTGGLEGANRFVWSGTGDFQRVLPPGKYEVWATAGYEREAKTWKIEVKPEQTIELSGELPRAYATPGWLSADLHLHQAPSPDSDIGCNTRVISVAAEGVELAAATDHYAVADLGPSVDYLVKQGLLATPITTLVGSEVSTVGNLFGHFNLFPMQAGDFVEYRDTTPKRMFAQMRQVAPKGLIQVNHPRMDQIGYWARYKLDPTSMQVPLQYQAEYSEDYDLLEVFNGLEMMSEPKLRKVLFDWIKLLGRGHRYTGTGNSDSHNLFFLDPGLPRNYIRVPSSKSDAGDLKVPESEVIEALRKAQVTVSSGPWLEVDVNGKGPGETVKAAGSKVPLHVRVHAASWISVDSVEVLLGGNGRRVRWLSVKEKKAALRFDQTIQLDVPGKTFVVVLVKGTKALPNTFTPNIKPFAFSNPIWLEP